MKAISICTTNQDKIAEFQRLTGRRFEPACLELDEIQSLDTETVCRGKAAEAYRRLGRPVVVDDTGFEMEALGGFPGALVTWVLAAGGPAMLHRLIEADASARAVAVTAIGFADDTGVHVFTGRVEGTVLAVPRGRNGFGFDPVFVPEGDARSFAEMGDEDKDRHSPRGVALACLATYLAGTLY
ncbi:MAG: non-canonical purine NTP pyrophosphatase [Sphingomonas sp.]|jgi:XTP/dITP diphosphohydrolase|uniref:non-canonical purine NTP pyrophosphatase n=1 Tax=Sphingomonas sp. TaxID=28214 RepID=UPI00356990AE